MITLSDNLDTDKYILALINTIDNPIRRIGRQAYDDVVDFLEVHCFLFQNSQGSMQWQTYQKAQMRKIYKRNRNSSCCHCRHVVHIERKLMNGGNFKRNVFGCFPGYSSWLSVFPRIHGRCHDCLSHVPFTRRHPVEASSQRCSWGLLAVSHVIVTSG